MFLSFQLIGSLDYKLPFLLSYFVSLRGPEHNRRRSSNERFAKRRITNGGFCPRLYSAYSGRATYFFERHPIRQKQSVVGILAPPGLIAML